MGKYNTTRRNAVGMPLDRKGPAELPIATDPRRVDGRPTFPAKDLSQKGKLHGLCNRSACLQPGARWFNTSTRAYYCGWCAKDISDYAKRAEGYHICFYTTGDADEDAKMEFGKEYGDIRAR